MMRPFLSSIGAMALATSAFAQDAPSTAGSTQSSTAPSNAAGQAVLSEIVVTASRRAENVQRAALSIQALSSEALTRANVTKPEDLNSIATGVQIGTGANYPQVYIRGIGNAATNALAESAVAFNLDGVYISQAQSTRGMFYDLERVEVLKGPQGTLYGRNASGGAINVITVKPKLGAMGGFAEVQAGNYDAIQGTAAVNLPLGDTAAIRASGQLVDRDGYLTDGYNDEEIHSGRLQWLWQPSADLSLLLNGNYQDVGGKGTGSVVSPQLPGDKFRGASDPAVTAIYRAQPGIGSLLVHPEDDGYVDYTTYAAGAEVNWNLGFATLTVLPAYRDSILRERTYVPGFLVANEQHLKQSSVEARLGNDGEQLKWVVGAYYFDLQQNNRHGRPAQVVLQGVSGQSTPQFDLNTRSYALFGQTTYSVTERLRLTGGLRYTHERKLIDTLLNGFSLASGTPPTCGSGTVFDPTSVAAPPLVCRRDIPVIGELTYENVTYKAGVEFDLAAHSMAYANLSTGFKSGGFFQAPEPNTFRPEKLRAFEVGVKNRFLENRLQVNLEGFFWLYSDHQETSIGPTAIPGYFVQRTFNAGEAKSYGADIDILFLATSHDELSLKIQYNKTNYDSFTFSYPSARFGMPATGCEVGPEINGFREVDCSGKRLTRAPLWSGNAGYTHTFDLQDYGTLAASADVQFSSAADLSTEFLPPSRQDTYAMGNFDLTYMADGGRWAVSAFVRNIWDEAVLTQPVRSPFITQADPLADPYGLFIATVRPPRTYGARIRFNF